MAVVERSSGAGSPRINERRRICLRASLMDTALSDQTAVWENRRVIVRRALNQPVLVILSEAKRSRRISVRLPGGAYS